MGVAKQIIGSFEDIGRDIARETVKVPGDIAGKALESLGTTKQQGQAVAAKPQERNAKPEEKVDKATARAALEYLAGPQKQKEPTVQERLEQEKQAKNEKEAKQSTTAQKMAPIATGSSKPKRGNLYGAKQKKTATENKAARQD